MRKRGRLRWIRDSFLIQEMINEEEELCVKVQARQRSFKTPTFCLPSNPYIRTLREIQLASCACEEIKYSTVGIKISRRLKSNESIIFQRFFRVPETGISFLKSYFYSFQFFILYKNSLSIVNFACEGRTIYSFSPCSLIVSQTKNIGSRCSTKKTRKGDEMTNLSALICNFFPPKKINFHCMFSSRFRRF